MKTSEKLLTILTAANGSAEAAPQDKCAWDDLIATYLAAAIPVALWLESVGMPARLSQFVERAALEHILDTKVTTYGPLFPAMCIPLRLALDQFPDDSIEFAGLNPPGTIPGLGFLCLRATELTIETEHQMTVLAKPSSPPTNVTEFSSVPLNGWFKAEIDGDWHRKTSATAGSLTLDGVTHEIPFFEYDPVFTI